MPAGVPGLFGAISVADNRGARELCINGQLQGGCFLDPSAEIVSPGRQGPGPVSSSVYTLGWLAAGAHRPTASALMIGLGSGGGAIGFLYCFPGASLDVVEVDPAMARIAVQAFPLLQHYIDLDRLRIHIADAADYVAGLKPGNYDLALHDAYTGKPELATSGLEFYDALQESCGDLWLNVIGRPWRQPMAGEIASLIAVGAQPTMAMFADHSVMSPFADFVDRDSNWILTTADISPEILDAFEPYEELHSIENPSRGAVRAVDFARTAWEECLRRCLWGDELLELFDYLDGQ